MPLKPSCWCPLSIKGKHHAAVGSGGHEALSVVVSQGSSRPPYPGMPGGFLSLPPVPTKLEDPAGHSLTGPTNPAPLPPFTIRHAAADCLWNVYIGACHPPCLKPLGSSPVLFGLPLTLGHKAMTELVSDSVPTPRLLTSPSLHTAATHRCLHGD